MARPVIRETATVWRLPNGRRYLTRRAAFLALARQRMQRDHEDDYAVWEGAVFTPPEVCGCSWCRDNRPYSRAPRGKVWRRYTRLLMRHAGAEA